MTLRRFPTYEDWRSGGGADIAEINRARMLPESDLDMRILDQWVRWTMTTDHKWSVVAEANQIIQRVKG